MNGSNEYYVINLIESLNHRSAVNAGTSYYGSPWKSLACRSTFPGIGFPMNNGRLILEAGDSWGDEPPSVGGGDGSGRDLEESLGPDVQARLEGRVLLRRL